MASLMSAALAVLAPGLNVTIQDLGRVGWQAIGVPEGGALDPIALRLANWLVGSDGGAGALEMRFSGPSFEVRGGPVRLAVSGDGAEIEFLPTAEGRHPAYRSLTVPPGQQFKVILRSGAPCYLSVKGGFDIAPALGSRSTLAICGLGGFQGRALQAGDVLPLRLPEPTGRGERALRPPRLLVPEPIRVMLGPQADRFTAEALDTFFSESFTVSHLSDRMGLRLEGPALTHSAGFDQISDGNAPGAIQVPGSGRPIILLADRGTTGGYPKIATVISADLPRVGRIPPGAPLRFTASTQAEAVAALRAQDALLENLKAAITGYRNPDEALARALLEENIISGVTDAGH
jgi:biotin-dependent carboxylase-like uncharacterized protein